MADDVTTKILLDLISELELPDSVYERAHARYKSLGDWFARDESVCQPYSPHVYPQGSFRLGLVTRPPKSADDQDYDLDMGIRLRSGFRKVERTQADLKELVRVDLEAYRKAQQIDKSLEEMHRCWRLCYKDDLPFHLDAVPSIPEDEPFRRRIVESMMKSGSDEHLSVRVAEHAGAITDNQSRNYRVVSPDWRISNSEGYAVWFESRVRLAMPLLERVAKAAGAPRIDDLPANRWKSPLQQVIMLLKRHRDLMFADNSDAKPISIILTTLAARAYRGEQDLGEAIDQVLSNMGSLVSSSVPFVPNPVNPEEDFADKWAMPRYAELRLRDNFFAWLAQAQQDFRVLRTSRDALLIEKVLRGSFGRIVDRSDLSRVLGISSSAFGGGSTQARRSPIVEAPRPWRRIG